MFSVFEMHSELLYSLEFASEIARFVMLFAAEVSIGCFLSLFFFGYARAVSLLMWWARAVMST